MISSFILQTLPTPFNSDLSLSCIRNRCFSSRCGHYNNVNLLGCGAKPAIDPNQQGSGTTLQRLVKHPGKLALSKHYPHLLCSDKS